jgi:hypothetical protein
VELIVDLPEAMLDELRLAARERSCSPRQFAIETLESAIASRRLPKIEDGRRKSPAQEITDIEITLTEHRILL